MEDYKPLFLRRIDGLSAPEIAILQRIANGETDNEIAAGLHRSIHTVKTHARHVMQKLSASTRSQAVAEAMRKGLIQ